MNNRMEQQPKQHGIPITNAAVIADQMLQLLRKWLEEKEKEQNNHQKKNQEAVKSVHHTRLLLNLFVRSLPIKNEIVN